MSVQKITSKDSFAIWQDKNNAVALGIGDIRKLANRKNGSAYTQGVGLQLQVTSIDANGKITGLGIAATGTGAAITPTIVGGKITGFTGLTGGTGYLTSPYVIVNGSGTGFEGVAQLTGNAVSSISILDQGYGYEAGTTISFASKGGIGYRKYDVVEIRTSDNRKALVRVDTVDASGIVSAVTLISSDSGFTSSAYYLTERSITTELFKMEEGKVDRYGDIMTGALEIQNNFSVTAGTSSFSGLATFNGGVTIADGTTLTVNGNTILGNAIGDTVQFVSGALSFTNATAITIGSTLNFDSNTLVIDATNNRIGINKVPTVPLDLVGNVLLTTGSNVLSLTSASGLAITGATGLTGALTVSGVVTLNNATDSSSSITGGLIIASGVGIAKKLYVGTNLTVTIDITSPIHQGSIAASGTLTLKSTSHATKATAGILMTDGIVSTSTATGTLVITGGLGVSGAVFIGGNLSAVGTANILGTITSGTWNGTIITPTYGGTGQNFSTGTGYSKFTTGTAALVATIPNGDITATLSSKTIDNTNTIVAKDSIFTLQNATTATKQAVFDLASITAATTRTLTVPDASGTLVLANNTQTLSNKTLDNTNTHVIKDSLLTIQNATTTTKQAAFDLSGITAATTRTYTMPDASGTLVLTSGLGATGTWNISVSGNAATVTNGVVTTGSYADPSWITSLAKSKVGLTNVENTALSTWAGTANIATLGTIATGTWNATVISVTKGGTGQDFSASSGFLKFTTGAASVVSSIASADIATTLSNKTLTAATISGTVPTGQVLAITDAPLLDTSATNKLYVDTKTAGFQVKLTVVGATTTSLNATYNNGAGTLTSNTNSAFPVTDGVTYVLNDRILVKDQNGGTTSPPSDIANGIYTLTAVGSGATPWVLTRALDSDSNGELNNALVTVTGGSAAGGNSYLNSASPVTLGTTLIKFEAAGTSVGAGAGIIKNGSSLDIVGTTNRIVVNADSIDIGSDVSTISGNETYTGNKTFSTNVKFGTNLTKYSGNLTTTAITQVSLDSFASATYRSAKYLVQATDAVSGNIHLTELLIIKDNANNVYVAEYGTVISSAALFTATADYDGTTNVRLRITPASTNSTTFRFSCELITL